MNLLCHRILNCIKTPRRFNAFAWLALRVTQLMFRDFIWFDDVNELSNAKQKPIKDSYQGPFEARTIIFASFVLFESSVIIELLDSCSTWGEETIATSRNVSSLFPKDHFSSSNWLSILIYAISVCFLARNRIHQIIWPFYKWLQTNINYCHTCQHKKVLYMCQPYITKHQFRVMMSALKWL